MIANDQKVYLVYCNIGEGPTDVDDLSIGWTPVLYCANLRAKILKNTVKERGGDPSQVKIVPFSNIREMELFLYDFDEITSNWDVSDYRLWTYMTETPLSSTHIGIWTTQEIADSWEVLYNVSNGFKELLEILDMLNIIKDLLRDDIFIDTICSLRDAIYDHITLYRLRESFIDDIESILDGGSIPNDFILVRESFKQSTGLDIVSPNVCQYFHGVFDETEVFIRYANMDHV